MERDGVRKNERVRESKRGGGEREKERGVGRDGGRGEMEEKGGGRERRGGAGEERDGCTRAASREWKVRLHQRHTLPTDTCHTKGAGGAGELMQGGERADTPAD
jgi:hypothetical protein